MGDYRFTSLRKRLDQLGYRQPLVIEAVPLVEKLFSDLIHTTESFKKYKNKTSNIDTAVTSADVNETYRVDNARLVRETNDLHLQLIKSSEENEKLSTELKSAVRKLEHENQDLRFLNSQYVHKIRNLEKESKLKTDHLQTLQEQNLKAVVETPGGRRKNIPFRRQRMDMECTLPSNKPGSSTNSMSISTSSDPYMADLLSIADKRMEDLKQQVEEHVVEKEKMQTRTKSLKKQVEARDKEINRLNDLLSGGRPVEAVLTDNKRNSGDRVVAHLNIQVDYLQQANRDLEKQIAVNRESQDEAELTIKTLQERNDELCLELTSMDKLYKNLDQERKRGDDEVDGQLQVLQNEVDEKHQNLLDLQSNKYSLKKERDELIEETERLNFAVGSCKEDKRNLAELYERCDKERRKLQEKNARLTVTERELVMDLERLKISKGILPRKTKSPDRIENLIRNLEEDRDYYKKEHDTLLEVVHKRLFGKDVDKKEEGDGITQILRQERDYYKKEYEILQNAKPDADFHTSPMSDKMEFYQNEASRLRRERDELQKLLEAFEKHLTQIQENVYAMTTDKNNVQMLYEQASEEIQRLRRQISHGLSHPGGASEKITSILEKAEKERDEALKELRKARHDIQGLKDDIKSAQKHKLVEKRSQNTKQQDLSDLLTKMEGDKETLNLKLMDTQITIQALEHQLHNANNNIRKTKEEVTEKESTISKMRLLLEESGNTEKELRKKIGKYIVELEEKNRDRTEVEGKLDSQKQNIQEYKNEICKLKNVVSTLDKERDTLHMQIDEKAEELVKLDNGLREKETEEADLKASIEEIEENSRNREQELLSKHKEISSLTKQIRSLENEIDGISKSRDATVKENKRIQDDLATMTVENQVVNKNLRNSEENVSLYQAQIQEYTLQMARIQDMLAQKELEKEELLLQYQTLSNKAEILESNIQQTEDNVVTCQQNLLHRQQELNYLQDRCAALEAEIEQHISTEESYECEISSLTKSLANIEAQLRASNEEKENIVQDLYSVRELCVKLDQTREELTKTLSTQKHDYEKLQRVMNENKAETEYLKSQVQQEKDTVKSLENVISAAREKEFYEKKLQEEGFQELEKTTEELSKTEQDRNLKNVENANLRLQNLSLQEELTSLRKQLTGEKFERERLKQEFRRAAQSTITVLETSRDNDGKAIEVSKSGQKVDGHSGGKENIPYSPVRPNLNESFPELNVSSEADSTK